MSTILKAVLIVGPTGYVGQALCASLIPLRSQFERIAFFEDLSRERTPEKEAIFKSFRNGGMEHICGYYGDSSAFSGFDCVMMPLGNHAIKHQTTIIDSAIAAGVRHFYPSEWGADITAGSNWNQRYYRDKVLTRLYLETRGQPNDTPDLGWTFVIVGRLAEYSIIRHFGIDNSKHQAEIFGKPSGRQSLLSTPDAIAFTIATLQLPVVAPGIVPYSNRRSFYFHGSSPTWDEIFRCLETVTGHHYSVNYRDVEEALEKEVRAKELKDIDLELEASHQLIQGREGTLLEKENFANDLFPNIIPETIDVVFKRIFADPKQKQFLGLS